MDFYKTNQIQLSDFQRIVENENPYRTSLFKTDVFGGNLNTFDWKLNCIQQIGLVISKKFSSVQESFEVVSERLQKITFAQFKKFITDSYALQGFNLTNQLIQKLFSELDPHKKGFLTEHDWSQAFSKFPLN